jgi:formamidopyrimidine-DNA glycosylase
MPELPEVEAITAVVARHSIGQTIESVQVIRQPGGGGDYFGDRLSPVGLTIERVNRRGKHVLFWLSGDWLIDCHNAMTGYWDYEDEPWTFDYVEGPRSPGNHVRLRMELSNGKVLRFNDARLFGRLRMVPSDMPPSGLGPELLVTPHGQPGAPVITPEGFAKWLKAERRPVKLALMEQDELAGIGNIYANEACHLAGIDPRQAGRSVRPDQVQILLESLQCVVAHCIPKVRYDWLKVYRRRQCGSCGGVVDRTEVAKRATFSCKRCQGDPNDLQTSRG